MPRATGVKVLAQTRSCEVIRGPLWSLWEALGGIDEGESLVRLVWAEALASAGPEDKAREAIAVAYRRLVERAEKIRDTSWCKWFFEVMPENISTRELEQAWGCAVVGR